MHFKYLCTSVLIMCISFTFLLNWCPDRMRGSRFYNRVLDVSLYWFSSSFQFFSLPKELPILILPQTARFFSILLQNATGIPLQFQELQRVIIFLLSIELFASVARPTKDFVVVEVSKYSLQFQDHQRIYFVNVTSCLLQFQDMQKIFFVEVSNYSLEFQDLQRINFFKATHYSLQFQDLQRILLFFFSSKSIELFNFDSFFVPCVLRVFNRVFSFIHLVVN